MRQQSSLVLLLAMSLLAPACSWMSGSKSSTTTAKIPMMGSTTVPGAVGSVSTRLDSNGNTELTVKVEHIAPAARVQPNATAYVVWIVPREGAQGAAGQVAAPNINQNPPPPNMQHAINAGRLEVKSDQTGSLKTVTSFTSFDIMITPEATAFVQLPNSQPVLSVRVTGQMPAG